jgi:xanthine dehydrogenase accessory factor
MDSPDLEVVRAAVDFLEAGHQATLATVVTTWGSSPRPPGSLMVIRDDGAFAGSVSGGCVEDDLIARVQYGDVPTAPESVVYGVSAEQTHRFGLPCGGRLELILEPLVDAAPWRLIAEAMTGRRLLARRLCLDTGEASLHPAGMAAGFAYDGRNLTRVFGPVWRLLAIGAGQLTRCLAEMALGLDYQVVVCDPRPEYAEAWQVAGAVLDTRMPDDTVRALAPDHRTAVVALTHDPKLDDMALMEALGSAAFYVGALGSAANNAKRRKRLAELGIPASDLARLHGPVGLPLGGRTPPEIALAILAYLTALRHGRQLVPAAANDRDMALVS